MRLKCNLRRKNITLRLVLALFLFAFSLAPIFAIQSNLNNNITDKSNYYQGVYGFLNGFDHQDPIESLDAMAQNNINLVILYGANYYVKTTVKSEKDTILEESNSKK